MATPLTQQQLAKIGRIQDLKINFSPDNDIFLYKLADMLEHQLINPVLIDSCMVFVDQAVRDARPYIVNSACTVLNQMIDPETGGLLPPDPKMFAGNIHFKWDELGNHKDAKSAIMHILNKCALVLNLGKP